MRALGIATLVALTMACTDKKDDNEPLREGLTDGGTYYIYWDSIPSSIPFNEPFKISAMVHDGEDTSKMYMDKELFVDATMPGHGHGMETTPEVTNKDGVYTVEGMLFHMAGDWELVFAVSDGTNVETAWAM